MASTISSTTTIYTPSTATSTSTTSSFELEKFRSFPAFYTLQPNLQTRARQLDLWSARITTYCAQHHLFRLSLSSLPPDLFSNASIQRNLKAPDIRTVLDHMSKPENGSRIEWIPSTTKGEQSSSCHVFWRTSAEWADMIYAWVDEIGQKNSVLTVYELRESDAVSGREWRDMDEGMLRRVLGVLVKRGKAQVFGQDGGDGVKFF